MSGHVVKKAADPLTKSVVTRFLGAKNLLGGLGQAAFYDRMMYGGYSPESWSERRVLNGVLNTLLGAASTRSFRGGDTAKGLSWTMGMPTKDALLLAGEPLHKLPKFMDSFIDSNNRIADNGQGLLEASDKDRNIKLLLGALGIGAAAYGGKKILDHVKDRRNEPVILQTPEDGGRVRITLPTRAPGDAETVVDLPISSVKLPNTISTRLRRDVKRKLRAETRERTYRRGEDGELDKFDYRMLPDGGKTAAMNREFPLGRPHEKIIPIRISTAREQWQQNRQEQAKTKQMEMKQQIEMRRNEQELRALDGEGAPPSAAPAKMSPMLRKRVAEIRGRASRLSSLKMGAGYGDRQRAFFSGNEVEYDDGFMGGAQKAVDYVAKGVGGRFGAGLNDLRNSAGNGNWGRAARDLGATALGALDPLAQWFSFGLAPRLGRERSREAAFRESMGRFGTYTGGTGTPTWSRAFTTDSYKPAEPVRLPSPGGFWAGRFVNMGGAR